MKCPLCKSETIFEITIDRILRFNKIKNRMKEVLKYYCVDCGHYFNKGEE